MTNPIEQLRGLRRGLQAVDAALRATSPKCSVCGLPTSGIAQGNASAAEAGICVGNHEKPEFPTYTDSQGGEHAEF